MRQDTSHRSRGEPNPPATTPTIADVNAVLAALLLVPFVSVSSSSPPSTALRHAEAPAVHAITISGEGVAAYPAFDPSVTRYGITTTDASTGSVDIQATTNDANGTVMIDGRRAGSGKQTVSELEPGDEISVIITDSGGTKAYSMIYLPAGMHALTRSGTGYLPEQHTLLTLSAWKGTEPFYEVAVDANGVPVAVHEERRSAMDFKRQPDGRLSVSRGSAVGPGREGQALVTLGDDLSETGRYETVGLVNTDGHDSILLPDGSVYLVSYEHNPDSGLTDSVIQHVGADGVVRFEWNSADHVDPASETVIEAGNPDYAHINSIQLMDDGDILASFRHLSAVLKIARRAHDGFAEGDVVWRFGGRLNDYTFPDDVHGGPCAQHTASQLDNGNLLIFDNGAWSQDPLCVNPADRAGPAIGRIPTRITEYALDEGTRVAHLVWEYVNPSQYALFAGSAEQLQTGNTLVGWASARDATVSEIDPDGQVVWELTDAEPVALDRQFTYRAARTMVQDRIVPEVTLSVPEGATYDQYQTVQPSYSCTDRGGSSLQDCSPTGLSADLLDTTTPGPNTVSVTGRDGAGNLTTVTRNYIVKPVHRPDGMIRKVGVRRFTGNDVFGPARTQRVSTTIARRGGSAAARARFVNDGNVPERFLIKAARGSAKFRVTYHANGRNVTGRLVVGAYRTPVVEPGERWGLRIRVVRTALARKGDEALANVRATSTTASAWDAVSLRVRAR